MSLDQLDDYYRDHGILARHEAGHTVVAWALGLDVERVVALGSQGRTVLRPRGPTVYSRKDRERDLMTTLAGMRAERSHFAWTDELRARWPRSHDHALLEEHYARLHLGAAEEAALRARMLARVDALLDRHGRFLDRVHGALVGERGWLSRARLVELWRAG